MLCLVTAGLSPVGHRDREGEMPLTVPTPPRSESSDPAASGHSLTARLFMRGRESVGIT